jgi:hypothetical protein
MGSLWSWDPTEFMDAFWRRVAQEQCALHFNCDSFKDEIERGCLMLIVSASELTGALHILQKLSFPHHMA